MLNILSIFSMPNIFIMLIAPIRIAIYNSPYSTIIIIFIFTGIAKKKKKIQNTLILSCILLERKNCIYYYSI